MRNIFSIYSMADTAVILYHPAVGRYSLSEGGAGRITIARSGDLSSHTVTPDGTVVINRLCSRHGTVTVEIPQNSAADLFMRRWISYMESRVKGADYAAATLTVRDAACEHTYILTGVTPQKWPDITYDRTAGNVVYTLLAASVSEQ